jgi:phosphoglycolate phosphatase
MKKLGLIFDLDGTLIDSGPDLVTAVNLTLAELGLPPLPGGDVARYLGHGPGRLIRDVMGPEYAELAERAFPIFNRHYTEHLAEGTIVYEGIRAALEHWQNSALMGVVTNKEQGWTDELLRVLELGRFFTPVLGHGALPEHKPHPAPLHACAAHWGLSPRACVMIGDSEVDIQAGKAAGMWTCGVTWGNRSAQQVADLAPDFIIHEPGELVGLFDPVTDSL